METLEELYEIFYSVPDPGGSDEYLLTAIDNWLPKKNLTRKQIFQLLHVLDHKQENHTVTKNEKYACILGIFYYYGIGTPVNYELAFEHYKVSAESNDALGQNQLGYCYHYGTGTIKDRNAGFEWFRRSAMNGNICGQRTLGHYYYFALACSRDYRQAFYWYMKAHESGNPRAARVIATCYFEGNGTFLDYHCGFRWARKTGRRYLHHAISHYQST
ncbi:5484_t:CDS:1 [Ambispora gerdemannii]|uniref:5484_t:CDS:1 n=1 Tax=Ambispora gerdemannii TaxID=144530 RepID=A0A9N9FCC5_9GLOM|nr:5484_t:CDS:1 [Ambispora gerdemannii]